MTHIFIAYQQNNDQSFYSLFPFSWNWLSSCVHIDKKETTHIVDDEFTFFPANNNIPLGNPVYDKDRQFVNFTLQNELTVGEFYNITVDYSGKLDNDLAGLYYSSYEELNTTTNQMEKRSVTVLDSASLGVSFSFYITVFHLLISTTKGNLILTKVVIELRLANKGSEYQINVMMTGGGTISKKKELKPLLSKH